ncbi:hypothetical protein ACRPLG_02465 [Bacillus safensis]|uniref:hypothetical protein n=1 Tax=Bacillus safensis TaxID=561879 RepID=UPI003D76D8B9
MFNKNQEAAISVMDVLVEDGVDLTRLSKELSLKEYSRVKKRLNRAFGSINEALRAYGLLSTIPGNPSEFELNRCFLVDDDYRVVQNDYTIVDIKNLYNLPDIEFKRVKNKSLIKAQREALGTYVMDTFPHGLLHSTLETKGKYHIKHYINKFYRGNIGNLCRDFGLDINLLVDCGCRSTFILYGRKFENLVKRVLDTLYPGEVHYQVRVGDSVPDFIVEDIGWVDAKLSKSTAFNRRCSTITKYLKHTDKLTIIFAIDKPTYNADSRVNLVSIKDFKRDLKSLGRFDICEEIDAFISDYLRMEEARVS